MDSVTGTAVVTSKKNKKSLKKQQASDPAAVDVTDTVALLTPYITEVDLWPAVTHSLCSQSTNEVKKRKSINIGEEKSAQTDLDVKGSPAVVPQPATDRNVFLKEAKTVSALRYLENAMCDIRYDICFSLDQLYNFRTSSSPFASIHPQSDALPGALAARPRSGRAAPPPAGYRSADRRGRRAR